MRPTHPATLSLRETLPGVQIIGSRDIRFSSCCSHPQACRPGDLFVALETAAFDGHELAAQALERGAQAVLAERLLPLRAPVGVVDDTRDAYGRLCQQLAGQPSRALRTVGVGGSLGKTTTARMLAAIFRSAGQRSGLISANLYDDSRESTAAEEATPCSGELADWLARMVQHGCRNAVLEVGDLALAERRLAGVGLDLALLARARRNPADPHGSAASRRGMTARLFDYLKPGGAVVVNADDPACRGLLAQLDRPALTVSMLGEADVMGTVIERCAGQQTMLITAGSETAAIQTRWFGDHLAVDCLVAAAAGLLAGLELSAVARGLESLDSIAGRLEAVACGQPFGVYVDAAASPDALAATLRSLRQVTPGRVLCVFGADAERDAALRPLLGRVVERNADIGVITNDNPRGERPLDIAHGILDGYQRPASARVLPDRAEAIRWVLAHARSGDCVLIAGKGDCCVQVVGEQRRAFDDRAIASRLLRGLDVETEPAENGPVILPFPSRAAA